MSDVKCPYCEEEQEINHDDGQGYEENTLHHQECNKCEKTFTFTTGIIYVYHTYKADCLNGSEHNFKASTTYPREFTVMRCSDCEEERKPTPEEMEIIMNK